MRCCYLFLIVSLIALVARPSAAQKKDEAATAQRIVEIQREIRGLQKEIAHLRAEMAKSGETREKRNFQKEIEDLLNELGRLRNELRRLQPAAKANIKTGVSVICTLEFSRAKEKMLPEAADYGEGATIRILAVKEKKILAEGKTDPFGEITLAVPPGKYLVEAIPRSDGESFGPPIEVTVEKDKVTAVAFNIAIRAR